jgi:hypothetical protein
MSKAQHTPGPWKAVRESALDYRPMQIITANGESRIATCDGGGPVRAVTSPEERANAELIASAPDMLGELTALRQSHDKLRELLTTTHDAVVTIFNAKLADDPKASDGSQLGALERIIIELKAEITTALAEQEKPDEARQTK